MNVSLYISYPLIIYLIVCVIILSFNDLINKYYKLLTSLFTFIAVSLTIGLCSYLFTSNWLWIFFIYNMYWFNTIIITKIYDSSKYFMVGILIALFQSEYWEYPIFLFFHNSFNITPIIVFIYIIYTMKIIKFDYKYFTLMTLIFTVPYWIIVYLVYPINIFRYNYIISDFFFRIICSIYFILIIYYYDKIYKIKGYLLGGTL